MGTSNNNLDIKPRHYVDDDRTKILKEDGYEFVQYGFSRTVICASLKLNYWCFERLRQMKKLLKRQKVYLVWSSAAEDDRRITRNGVPIECYKKYPAGTLFLDKVEDIRKIIEDSGIIYGEDCEDI